jgi:hypothetical protein
MLEHFPVDQPHHFLVVHDQDPLAAPFSRTQTGIGDGRLLERKI